MAKVEITKTELVWPGKYNEDGMRKEVPRVNLPFQIIETINESRATREAKKESHPTLFDMWEGKEGETFEEGWKNKLIWGDNLLVMGSLLDNFAGKIDLIYIDPPFATGADFSFVAEIGERGVRLDKEQSVLEEKAYRDTWGHGLESYLQMMAERLTLLRDLLSSEGHLFIHIAPGVSGYLHSVLDELFGSENFRNEIVVHRPITKNLQRQFDAITALPQGHDVILWYSSQPGARVPNLLVPYEAASPEGYWHRFWSGADRPSMRYELLGETPTHGQWKWERERALRAVENYDRFLQEGRGRSLVEYWRDSDEELEFIRKSSTGTVENWFPPSDDKVGDTVWDDVKAYENRKDYATQKHEELLDRIVNWLSKPGDLVADFFCGSGTTGAVAEKLGRRWIMCDLSRWAIHVTRKRLLGIEGCKPFEVLNLGKYERKYWQGVTFGEGQKEKVKRQNGDQQWAIFQYIAFILKLYCAEPLAGMQHLHGKKGKLSFTLGRWMRR
jgi:DNA modification methylase